MSDYAERWYLCLLTERMTDDEEPDWSRVPEQRRSAVQAKWKIAHERTETSEVKLWGPQIPFFARQYQVEVIR